MEIPPSEPLAPYVCCYWESFQNIATTALDTAVTGIVIPDTCMDILLQINFTENTVQNTFCGINTQSFRHTAVPVTATACTFAVRFYAWAAVLFTDGDMRGVSNTFSDSRQYCKSFQQELQNHLLDSKTMAERIRITEQFLLKRLTGQRKMPT